MSMKWGGGVHIGASVENGPQKHICCILKNWHGNYSAWGVSKNFFAFEKQGLPFMGFWCIMIVNNDNGEVSSAQHIGVVHGEVQKSRFGNVQVELYIFKFLIN